MLAAYQEAAETVFARLPQREDFSAGLILGSGLGSLGERLTDVTRIPYGEIPGFALSTAPGHSGCLLAGTLGGKRVLCMQGRHHRYEGCSFAQIIFPIRVLALMGVKTLLVTNAAGGIDPDYSVGNLMLIADHINLMGGNPLAGLHCPALGERFFDMTAAYAPSLRRLAKERARAMGIALREGVYLAVTGPSYETPAEIRAFRLLGASAVGMSTVPEVTAARHCGMRVLGCSVITNMAAGITDAPLTGEEVLETGRRIQTLAPLMESILAALPEGGGV
ncbi:MAG: purine-nucleoside phosphorylase [Oscillospiraceae bacterium]|jgi:purine-nucleoside phosphorylase|nr:purine-nucleoside phosphorylase [Oscillospiraceae bacterium]